MDSHIQFLANPLLLIILITSDEGKSHPSKPFQAHFQSFLMLGIGNESDHSAQLRNKIRLPNNSNNSFSF